MKLAPFRQPALHAPFLGFAFFALLWPNPPSLRGGDILRGGAPAGNPGQRAQAAARATAVAAAQARNSARDNLARTTAAIQAVRAMQVNARATATANHAGVNPNATGSRLPGVPNGLAVGGLQVDPNVNLGTAAWSGASRPTQSTSGNRTTVNIRQTQQTALLSWRTFNVGRQTTVRFDQRAGGSDVNKWVAFNRINDPSNAPSQILGSIEAPGQVYVVNRNGIIFGAGSQVNTGTLVASSLPINTNLIERGLLNNPDAQFLFSGLAIPAGTKGTPAFTPEAPNPAIGRYGDVIVQRGASITAPTNSAKSGGRVMLVGPKVTNAGSISTPDGQTILAAGMQVGFDAHPSSDPSLRGLDVYVGSVTPPYVGGEVGQVTQSGLVEAPRGNITLAGREIRQDGALVSSTSVSLNGRIDLQANFDAIPNPAYNPASAFSGAPFLFQKTGTVRLGKDSVTRILPEWESTETVIGTELALRSQANLVGRAIFFDRESTLQAPSGDVRVTAGEWRLQGLGGTNPISRFIQSDGQIYLDRNALIDAAGSTGISVPILQHLLTLELRGAELANSPLQRESVLRNASIVVDARNSGTYGDLDWIGTPLADATGFAGLIQRTVGQFTARGGRVTLSAGQSVVMQEGSRIDVSGGYLNYEAGTVRTTRLRLHNRVVDIQDATPDRLYDAIYTGTMTTRSERWGVTRTYQQPLALTGEHYEPSYIEGAPGGSVEITASGMALDGNLVGRTVEGTRQREEGVGLSSLRLAFTAQDVAYPTFPTFAPTPPQITFRSGFDANAAAPFSVDVSGDPAPLRNDRLSEVVLSPDLLGAEGFGNLTLDNPDGDVSIPSGVSLDALPRGSVGIRGSNLSILGRVSAPGGSLTFTSSNVRLSTINTLDNSANPSVPAPEANRGRFLLGTDALLSTAGAIADDRPSSPAYAPLAIAGGSIRIAGFSASLRAGSTVDVSGGVRISADGDVTYGSGGNLSIAGGVDPSLEGLVGGRLDLGGNLRGFSGTEGASLTLAGPAFQIGGTASPAGVNRLAPGFFSSGGFANFSLSGTGLPVPGATDPIPGVRIAPGTVIQPLVRSWLAVPNGSQNGTLALTTRLQPEGLRTPVSLSFQSPGASDPFTRIPIVRGDVVVGNGTRIEAGARGSVSFQGETVSLNGTVRAPGGEIEVEGAGRFPTPNGISVSPLATVHLGSGARLLANGTAVIRPGLNGWRSGEILPGGTISLSGNLVAERGSLLDVSGTSGVLDQPSSFRSLSAAATTGFAGQRYVPVRYESDGGDIQVAGGQMLYVDSTLRGTPGGPSANGGSLNVSSGRFIAPGAAFTSADETLVVTQNRNSLPVSSFARGIGLGVRDASGTDLPGIGNFSADRFHAGRFASLTLSGNVGFDGPVRINAPSSLRVASGGIIRTTDSVNLEAAHVVLGRAFRPPSLPLETIILFTQTDAAGVTTPYHFAPTHGTGSLNVRAGLIDVGDLSLASVGRTSLNAQGGDLRGNGTLQMAGDLVIRAAQAYPTTLGRFDVFAYDAPGQSGSITVLGGGTRALPLTAGGTLSLHASKIHQGGTLRSPIGSIQLGWDGTGTAPANPIAGSTLPAPVTTRLVLGSTSVTSVSGIDPRSGRPVLIPYGISFDGNAWIDPAGNDITVGGLPSKTVNLSGADIETRAGSVVDIRGGGDLFAYRWLQGNGGTRDLLASPDLFAVIPGFGFDYAPYAPFNTSAAATNLQGQEGYVNSSLRPGDRITLGGSDALPAGTYTLLPARYALLPGAVLVTPQAGDPVGTRNLDDGSSIVSGFRSNDLNPARTGRTEMHRFEIAPASVVAQRAEYVVLRANTFLRDASSSRGFVVPRLPVDSGYVSFNSTAAMALAGRILSSPPRGGRGSLIDISSPGAILVNRDGRGGAPGTLVLAASLLNSFDADSLLLGGRRTFQNGAWSVDVSTTSLTVDNGGSPLVGSDLVLVANESISLADGASILGSGNASLDPLLIGNESAPGSGDGVLVRVSGSRNAPVTRSDIGNSTVPSLAIGNATLLKGGSITLDSTHGTAADPGARIIAPVLSLSSGQISVRVGAAAPLNPTDGLVLSGPMLQTIRANTTDLSLFSYSSIDLHGAGTFGGSNLGNLSLRAAAIRGFGTGGGGILVEADRIRLDNSISRTSASLPPSPLEGSLRFDAGEMVLGQGDLRIERFSDVTLSASNRLLVAGTGSFAAEGNVDLLTPLVTGSSAANHRVAAGGNLRLIRPAGRQAGASGGLGARIAFEGDSIVANTDLVFRSGRIGLRATSGDLTVGSTDAALLDAGGISRSFLETVRHTSGGTVSLSADLGSVNLSGLSRINVAAPSGGGDAGFLDVSAPSGSFTLAGSITGGASANRRGGSFSLDAASIAGDDLAATDAALNAGRFNESRDYRIRTGNLGISGSAVARTYRAFADDGSIELGGVIDASGTTGGRVEIGARLDLVVTAGARIDVSALRFDAAGKGGSVYLGAGSSGNGQADSGAALRLDGGAIDLSVDSLAPDSASRGQFAGTVHLRAPRNAAGTDVQIDPIGTTIDGASAIVVEGYGIYDRALQGGTMDTALLTTLQGDGVTFLGAPGTTTPGYSAMLSRLTASQPGLDLILVPGAEVVHLVGDLTLGSPTSTTAADWNFAALRFGPRSAAGMLTLRASGNIDLFNAVSDGFAGGADLWRAPLVAHNPLLPANSQSWSYRMAAGADFSAADARAVRSPDALATDTGLIRLGKNAEAATATGGNNATTASVVNPAGSPGRFQVIRTGSGFIDLNAGRSVQLLNPFAAVYTAGTQVANPNAVFAPNDFVTPVLGVNLSQPNLGVQQQNYSAQYAMAGGNVSIRAGENIERKTRNSLGILIDDSSRQLPNNWLYRRGYVTGDGTYGAISIGSGFTFANDAAASTSWWVDYSNFFQSVGALGGGNVTMIAGNEVRNVDAAIPTNARAPRGQADPARLVELGGGDLLVRSGGDINGGVYYVERGRGRLEAEGGITTNGTRSPSRGLIENPNNPSSAQLDPLTWMPTTLFVGRSSFEVTANRDVLLGPVANAFLMPTGLNNRFWYKTYFSTYGTDSGLTVSSLGGDVTFRNAVTLPGRSAPSSMLSIWMETQNLLATGSVGAAISQPWLRLGETTLEPFGTMFSLYPTRLSATSHSGDIRLVGNFTLSPSASGQLELASAGSIEGLLPTGRSNTRVPGQSVFLWDTATINVSDANPASVPGATNPFNYFAFVGAATSTANNSTRTGFLASVARLFTDSGSTTGSFGVDSTKQALHAPGPLHLNDPDPVRLYATGGDISGLTLFTPKQTRIYSSRDVSDIAFYLQNLSSGDTTVVSAGRDIIPFNSASPSRSASLQVGNALASGRSPLAGDIHIGGPGSLQILAGRHLDLGTGEGNADGTGSGILSIGNTRNPFLPFAGADLFIGAGLGPAASLGESRPDFDRFIRQFVETTEGRDLLRELGVRDFSSLGEEEQAQVAMKLFYLVLRNAGRDFNDEDSPDFGTYDNGFAAIRSLFGSARYDGDLLTRSRSIRTQNGGDISLFAPGGALTLANTTIGNPLVPPGIVTESGGRVSIFTHESVDIGVGRIFTLRGGDMVIWSSTGDIAAGVASKTVQSAPPTRVLIDPQSAAVETDLAGLATGGGIGVLATVAGVKPGNVDLIAPAGIIDAGDAGIRVTGNINLAATQVVNASNIAAGGNSTGAPTAPSVSTPSVGGLSSAASTAAAASDVATNAGDSARDQAAAAETQTEIPSLITVEVLGYGGGAAEEEDEDEEE